MALDKDESTRKAERDAAAEMKRQQNALPSWHLKSTITGDLTALGVKENRRLESLQQPPAVENDDILKGLGVARSSTTLSKNHQLVGSSMSSVQEDVKPRIDPDADRAYSAML